MNHSACYGTPERRAASRRFCSTPIGPGYPPDDEGGGEEDIYSFLSSMDEFIEKLSMYEALPSPSVSVTRQSSASSNGQPVEQGDPLFECVPEVEGEEEEDTYCEYRDAPPPEEPYTWPNDAHYRSARATCGVQHGDSSSEHSSRSVRMAESHLISESHVPVGAQHQRCCPDFANCNGGLQCLAPRNGGLDHTLTPRCVQTPEPEVKYGYYASHPSRRLFEGYDEVPREPQPDLYMETYTAYCETEERPAASREHGGASSQRYRHGGASERHSASCNASVKVKGDPIVICIDDDDDDGLQQDSTLVYDADYQMEDPTGHYEYPQESDLHPQLLPTSRRPMLDSDNTNEQQENNSKTNCHSSVTQSSRSYHEQLNLSKELNRTKAEASSWDIAEATNQRLTCKKLITRRPFVAVSMAQSAQSKQFSLASEPELPVGNEDSSYNGSVIMEDASTPERCINECRLSNYSPSCKTDNACVYNKCSEGNHKLDADSRPFCKSMCSRRDTPAAVKNENLQPSFLPSVTRSLNPYGELNGPKTEATNVKTFNEPLASKEAGSKCTALAASSAASAQCQQSATDCDITLPSKNESAKLHLHKATENESAVCSTGAVQPKLATRGYSPLFFTDITRTVSAPHTADSKPTFQHPSAIGFDKSTEPLNNTGQPQRSASSLECFDEIDETLITSSTPSEDEIELDEANLDLEIDEIPSDSSPPNTPVGELVPTSSMLQAHSETSQKSLRDDISETSEKLDTTLVAPADAATNHAVKSNTPPLSPSSIKSADVLDIHLDAEERTFVSNVPPVVMELSTSTVTRDLNSPVIPAKSTPTLPSELQRSAVLPKNPQRTSAPGLEPSTLAMSSISRTNRDSVSSPVRSAALSLKRSKTDTPDQMSPKSVDQSASLLRATLLKNTTTQNFGKPTAHSKVHVTKFMDDTRGSSPESLQGHTEAPLVDFLEEGEVLSTPTNSPVASRVSTPSLRHSVTGLLTETSPVDQSPNLLQALNSKTHSSAEPAAHFKVQVTNFLDEYEGGSSPGSLQNNPEYLEIDLLEEGEVLSSLASSPSANRDTTPSPVPSAASSLSHSGTGSPAQRFPKSMLQSPNLLQAALVKNLKAQNSAKPTAHSKVQVTNFLNEYAGGSSPESLQGNPEVFTTEFLENDEVLRCPTHSSESEDLREKINAVRGLPNRQFEEKLSHGQNVEDACPPLGHSTTIDALCLEARQSGTSSEAPEVKVRIPFLSEDPAENLDNDNPAWEALRQLTTEEERYRHVHKVWRSTHVPDPHQELTTFHYRRRVAGLRLRVDTLALKRGKRRAPHEPSSSEGVGPAKRQRFDTDIFDLKLKELERKKARDFTEAKDNMLRNLDRLRRDIRRNEERQASSHSHQRHYHHNGGRSQRGHHRSETAPSDYRYWRMQEMQIHEEFEASAQCINDKFSAKEHQLLTARDEVHRFDAFYVGLHEDFDPRLLSESQLKQQLQAEKALGLFRLYYSPAQD